MSYFARFPLFAYTINNGETFSLVSDILRRISVTEQTKENFSLYEKYEIKDGETPEIVSFKFYNDPQYHWVIMLLNDIIDPRFDWPLTESQLYEYAYTKYSGNIAATKYYTVSSDDLTVVDPTQAILKKAVDEVGNTYEDGYEYPYATAVAVTNMDHESRMNESKRSINVLRPKYLAAFLTEFESIING